MSLHVKLANHIASLESLRCISFVNHDALSWRSNFDVFHINIILIHHIIFFSDMLTAGDG